MSNVKPERVLGIYIDGFTIDIEIEIEIETKRWPTAFLLRLPLCLCLVTLSPKKRLQAKRLQPKEINKQKQTKIQAETKAGDLHNPLHCKLYNFNGLNIKTLWFH